jgi:acyl dehydratase
MLGAGYLATLCTDHFGAESIRRFSTRFRHVVYRGEILTARADIVRTIHSGGERRLVINLRLTNENGVTVTNGEAEFALPH